MQGRGEDPQLSPLSCYRQMTSHPVSTGWTIIEQKKKDNKNQETNEEEDLAPNQKRLFLGHLRHRVTNSSLFLKEKVVINKTAL